MLKFAAHLIRLIADFSRHLRKVNGEIQVLKEKKNYQLKKLCSVNSHLQAKVRKLHDSEKIEEFVTSLPSL